MQHARKDKGVKLLRTNQFNSDLCCYHIDDNDSDWEICILSGAAFSTFFFQLH